MKLSCNATSSTANDNVWQIAVSAVKGFAKKQQTSSIAAKSANRPLNAVSRLLSTSPSTRLASAIRSSSSPQNSLVNLNCRQFFKVSPCHRSPSPLRTNYTATCAVLIAAGLAYLGVRKCQSERRVAPETCHLPDGQLGDQFL